MKKMLIASLALVFALGIGNVGAASRDYISIVGSSTVYPFATVVAENFGKATGFKTPTIESTGSGGGHKLFGAGVGVEYPDITNSSRRIKKSEFDAAAANGVTEIVEVKIGYDGIVIANSNRAPLFKLSRKDIFLALAKDVPSGNVAGKTMPNPNKTWKDVNSSLPDIKIEVLGPPPTSGTRDAFVELAMEGGAKKFAWIADLKGQDKKAYKALCHTIREDGAYIEAGENDNLIVQKLDTNPDALGIFGFSFLDQNADKLQGALVDGIAPEFEAIADGSYPVSRPLFFYVKKAHVDSIPGIREYLAEFTSEKAWGDEGYLTDKGLIPMPEAERKQFRQAVENLTPLSASDL
ncbi:PstS family phosphate ABC transporter substrate-binding protein [Desulfotignum phosphitoxidans]|uniref:ABC-type phosphate transport system periplasmic component PstS n=1 Tax=Desulfotignum phosphitoxidans DSM 13687 TaxID=1286635 RepID=S0FVQ7_9BACT|nr:PstS family phosphate ABC transporter substrate-binding protein [Desulfotignum phosphitoxidans]EMS77204.1 ABC-type phosphate transport system periplasmic component PstS [Desulfotignum phosphitoxidans DSM 13687]